MALAVLGAFAASLGMALLVALPWQGAREHLAARTWPVAEGRVLSVALSQESNPGPRGVETEMVLSAVYEYEVGGEPFMGGRAGLSDRAALHDRDLMTLYRRLEFARVTGRGVEVFHDPHDPSRAYLDIGFAWRPAAMRAVSGLAALGLGMMLLAGAVLDRRRTASSL